MKKEKRELIIDGDSYFAEVDIVEKSDTKDIAEMYELWNKLSSKLTKYNCRRVNFTEVSELIFCLVSDCWRTNNIKGITHSSFDCYNPQTHSRIQVKATSVEDDLTSFGPKSVWDELYFMDFFCNNEYDGSFDIYLIPNDEVYNFKMNKKNQTFVDQQEEGKRPRLHIKKRIIKPLDLKPIGSYNIYEL